MRKSKILICLWLVTIVFATALSPNAKATSEPKTAKFAPGEVIVGLNALSASAIKTLEAMGGSVIKKMPALNALVVQVSVGGEDGYIQSVHNVAGVKYAERNGKYEAVYTPNDPYWSSLWNMRIIKADKAWDTYKGSLSVVIAIADTGVDYTHPDLAAHYKSGGYDWVNNDADPKDDYGHGTHCAGIAGAVMDNSVGVAGVGQSAIWAEKVLNNGGSGYWDWIANGITHATDNGVNVISLSLGGTGYSSLLESACAYAWNHGVVIVAAAGNNNMNIDTTPFYPASYSTVIAVSATDSNDQKASFSNYGTKVELAAPGVSVYSTMPTYHVTMNDMGYSMNYDYMSGTSMACPHVAGLAALVKGYNTSMTNSQIRDKLHTAVDDLGTPGKDIYFGYGRINAQKALAAPSPPGEKWQYRFRLSPFVDQVWINATPQAGGMLLYGYANLTTTNVCYPAPVLGWVSGNSFYMAIDFKTNPSCYELGFIVGSVSTASGNLYRTMDGTTWVGPTAVTLVPFAENEGSGVSSASMDAVPQGWPYNFKFIVSPFVDRVYVHTDPQPSGILIHGYANLTTTHVCYPAPVLGIAVGNSFYMPFDYKTSPSCYELGFVVGTVSTRGGKLYRTMDGTSWVGPTAVTLVPF